MRRFLLWLAALSLALCAALTVCWFSAPIPEDRGVMDAPYSVQAQEASR